MSANAPTASHRAGTPPLSPPQPADVLASIVIPSCPHILHQLRLELANEDPDIGKIARWVGGDVALSVSVLRTVNSPWYGLRRKVDSIDQAVSLIGLRQLAFLVSGSLLRQIEQFKGLNLARFWDVSAKRAYAMSAMAKTLRGVDMDVAQSFGLFCDMGIPLLMQRFPSYTETLRLANQATDRCFTAVERERHSADHAHIGAIMARTWKLNDTLCTAIRQHHDYSIFTDRSADPVAVRLIAMGLVAELAIQRFARLNTSTEWDKGGEHAAGALMLSDLDVEDWVETLSEGFALSLN